MANKLKNMLFKSVDLVRRGANPDADIMLYKSLDGGPESEQIMKSETEIEDMIEKSADMIDVYTDALSKSFMSILSDETLGAEEAREKMVKSLKEFNETVFDDIVKDFSYTHEREGEEMNYKDILKSENLTDIEKEQLERLLGKASGKKIDKADDVPDFEIEDDEEEEEVPPTTTEKGSDTMKKSYYENIIKSQSARIEALEKQFAMKDLVSLAKKYEAIGENAEELAKTLYEMKEAGEDIYKTYVSGLDKTLELYQKSGLFSEIGKSYGAPVVGNFAKSDIEAKIDAFADGIMKAAPEMSRVQAVAKAWEDHPELASEYEMNRR